MVNAPVTSAREAERALAIGYAPAATRPALAALFALDRRLGELVAGTREPMVAQMRLTWWYEALLALDRSPAPAEPVLAAVSAEVLPRGVTGAELATMIDGWEVLLEERLDAAALDRFAQERGARLFTAAARLLGQAMPAVAAAAEGWALAEVAGRLGDAAVVDVARAAAQARWAAVSPSPWPRPLRPLGALVLLARADLAGTLPGSPRRVGRLLWHRLTGR